MAEENISDVKEIENCFNTNPPVKSEESSVVSKDQEECIPEINEVPKPQGVTLRRHSTGVVGTKPQVKSRYRGNHHVSSTHDLCKHGKRCDQDDAVKPWKIVEKVSETTSGLRRQSLRTVSRLIRVTKPCASVKEDSEIARSVDGSSVKSNDKARKKIENQKTLSGSAVFKKFHCSNTPIEKVSRMSDGESFKVCSPKNKEKAKTQTISNEDVKEKTVCVVKSSIKGVQREKQPSSEEKTMRCGLNSLTITKQISGKISTGLTETEKKESGSADLEANPKPEKKIRPKSTGVKESLTKKLSFKRGKVLEPKPEDSSPTWIKLRKKVVQEQKTQTEGSKNNLKDKRLVVETKSESCEGIKLEKVVLRHRKVEGKKKMMTLFNNVIEETMSKFTKARKDKVKALISAFETVISLQNTKTPQKFQSRTTTSASKVSPLVSEQ